MTDTILFEHKVSGHRTAPVVGYTENGLPICKIGNWKFAFDGKHRILNPGDAIPDEPTAKQEYIPVAELRVTMKSKPASERPRRETDDSPDVKRRACACGCGSQTASLFCPGHDARALGMLKKLHRGEITEIPDTLQALISANAKWRDKWSAIQNGEKVH